MVGLNEHEERHDNGMNLPVRPVTRLAGFRPSRDSHFQNVIVLAPSKDVHAGT